MNEGPTIWQRLGLEGKSIEEKANYWKREHNTSWNDCKKICPDKAIYSNKEILARKTILSSLGEQELEQAYDEIYGKRLFGLFDFGKKAKMKMLGNLLSSETLEEAMATYWRWNSINGDMLPQYKKLENYVWSYFKREKQLANAFRDISAQFSLERAA